MYRLGILRKATRRHFAFYTHLFYIFNSIFILRSSRDEEDAQKAAGSRPATSQRSPLSFRVLIYFIMSKDAAPKTQFPIPLKYPRVFISCLRFLPSLSGKLLPLAHLFTFAGKRFSYILAHTTNSPATVVFERAWFLNFHFLPNFQKWYVSCNIWYVCRIRDGWRVVKKLAKFIVDTCEINHAFFFFYFHFNKFTLSAKKQKFITFFSWQSQGAW